jgi:hypothetical protein
VQPAAFAVSDTVSHSLSGDATATMLRY